jgi:hypothetical protein
MESTATGGGPYTARQTDGSVVVMDDVDARDGGCQAFCTAPQAWQRMQTSEPRKAPGDLHQGRRGMPRWSAMLHSTDEPRRATAACCEATGVEALLNIGGKLTIRMYKTVS